jgi:enoyl-CoA hydratase
MERRVIGTPSKSWLEPGLSKPGCYTFRIVSFDNILWDLDRAGIAWITVNRPAKLNALSSTTIGELEQAFSQAASERAVRALAITGAGDKAFVAGADVAELAGLSPNEMRRAALRGQRVFRMLETMGKPSVAAVNGYALGGGLELAMAATVRFAAENAWLGQPEVKLGLTPGYGGTQRLPRLVGRGRALELLLSAEPITAAEAHRIGLVNAVVPRAELLAASRAWLEKVLRHAPLAISLAMEAVDTGLGCGLEEGLRSEAAGFGLSAATEDFREGTRAFLEKRSPEFAGK